MSSPPGRLAFPEMPPAPSVRQASPLDRFLAVLGAAACLAITVATWLGVSAYQGMWPLPGLYFIELPAVSITSAVAIWRGHPSASLIAWAGAGILSAFCILGAFSVGFLYAPVALIFAIVAVAMDVRQKKHVLAHLGACLIAGLGQGASMLALVRLLYPAAQF